LISIGDVKFQRQYGVFKTFFQIPKVSHLAGGSRYQIATLEYGFRPNATKTTRASRYEPDFLCHTMLL
jgi:hypothetical protein